MAAAGKKPRFRKRRAARIRTELGLWLSQHGAGGDTFSKAQIDRGREELGFTGVDDAMVAYTFFGTNLLPDLLEIEGMSALQAEIEAELESILDAFGLTMLDDGAV